MSTPAGFPSHTPTAPTDEPGQNFPQTGNSGKSTIHSEDIYAVAPPFSTVLAEKLQAIDQGAFTANTDVLFFAYEGKGLNFALVHSASAEDNVYVFENDYILVNPFVRLKAGPPWRRGYHVSLLAPFEGENEWLEIEGVFPYHNRKAAKNLRHAVDILTGRKQHWWRQVLSHSFREYLSDFYFKPPGPPTGLPPLIMANEDENTTPETISRNP